MNTRKLKRMLMINFTLVLSLVLAAQASNAVVFTYKFEATVEEPDEVWPWSPCGIEPRHHLSGTITYDTEAMEFDAKHYGTNYDYQYFAGQEFYIKYTRSPACVFHNAMFNYEYTTALYPQGLIVDGPATPYHDRIELFFDAAVPPFAHSDWDPWLSTAPVQTPPYFITLTAEMHDTEASYFDDFVLPNALGSIPLLKNLTHPPRILLNLDYTDAAFDLVIEASIAVWTLVETPTDYIMHLIKITDEINAQSGILNSLDAKLEAVVKALDDVNENNDFSTVNKLQAFINAVEAQRGNQISEDDADSLIAAAQEIIDMLRGQ